jgi:hypothetical protein
MQRYVLYTVYIVITHDPFPCSNILTVRRETLMQCITINRGGREKSVFSYSLGCSKVAQILLYSIMQILPLLCGQESLLLVEIVQCPQ